MEQVTILADGLRFPEGPAFDTVGRLWCVEQEGKGLFCRHTDGHTERFSTGGRPSGITISSAGEVWFCDSGQQAIRKLNPATSTIDTVIDQVDGQPLNWPNDLTFDEKGNLIFSCPGNPNEDEHGYVAVWSPDGLVQTLTEGLLYPNGLAFVPGSHDLLIAETHRQRIWCGLWDAETLSWENLLVWAVTDEEIGPDGIAFGPDGSLYAAMFGAGVIRVFDPNGHALRDIALPGKNPTNCTFDPTGQLGLIITEAERGELLSVRDL